MGIYRMTLFEMTNSEIERGAIFSGDQIYRYLLWRRRKLRKGYVGFIMLNPSTADATIDDPTIKRCLRRAFNMGFDGIEVCNLYAFRTTSPVELKEAGYRVGARTDEYIAQMAERCSIIILGWGNHAEPKRAKAVVDLVKKYNENIYHLGLTKSGQPRHPLYIPYDFKPIKSLNNIRF